MVASLLRPGKFAGRRAVDVADRTSTAVVYGYDTNVRRISNPHPRSMDTVTLTTLLEDFTATGNILFRDAELDRSGAHCGRTMTCLYSNTTGSNSCITLGHSVHCSTPLSGTPLEYHEAQHVADVETLGAAVFYPAYGTEFVARFSTCLCNSYSDLSFERRAEEVESTRYVDPSWRGYD